MAANAVPPHDHCAITKELAMTVQPALSKPGTAELKTWRGYIFDVRPVDPGDEDKLEDFFTHVSLSDLRFRFLSAVHNVSENFLKRLSRVDHDRTEDYLAFDTDGTLIATAMLAADETKERGEVAISVRSDFKGRGIGWTLLDHVARCARAKGIKVLEAIEDRGNQQAIEIEKEMGFTATTLPGDPTLLLVSKRLAD
jgi:N-acetylglutamate synthase-like GNAT family acetyltransferase